jgi:dimethylglycine dehydrogenase
MVKTDLAISGQTVSVDIFGNDFPAIIQNSGPLWDPNNEVLKV